MYLIFILALPAFTVSLPVRSTVDDSTCGYSACHATEPGYINIHIIPHSHDDVGWLKTVDQYYYGLKQNVQLAKVKDIIDTALDELEKNSDRRFIYVETAFLWKWWLENDEDRRQLMRDLINSGQLEIIGGAWSMNDEAATNYQSIIDQFTFALRQLNDSFGACGRPHVGWQIDPFGHSREMASIFAQLGYDGVFFARSDYQDRQRRYQTKDTEMIWQGSANLGISSRLFAATFNNSYFPPEGFCFDSNCGGIPINDDPQSPSYNVDAKHILEYINMNLFSVTMSHTLIVIYNITFSKLMQLKLHYFPFSTHNFLHAASYFISLIITLSNNLWGLITLLTIGRLMPTILHMLFKIFPELKNVASVPTEDPICHHVVSYISLPESKHIASVPTKDPIRHHVISYITQPQSNFRVVQVHVKFCELEAGMCWYHHLHVSVVRQVYCHTQKLCSGCVGYGESVVRGTDRYTFAANIFILHKCPERDDARPISSDWVRCMTSASGCMVGASSCSCLVTVVARSAGCELSVIMSGWPQGLHATQLGDLCQQRTVKWVTKVRFDMTGAPKVCHLDVVEGCSKVLVMMPPNGLELIRLLVHIHVYHTQPTVHIDNAIREINNKNEVLQLLSPLSQSLDQCHMLDNLEYQALSSSLMLVHIHEQQTLFVGFSGPWQLSSVPEHLSMAADGGHTHHALLHKSCSNELPQAVNCWYHRCLGFKATKRKITSSHLKNDHLKHSDYGHNLPTSSDTTKLREENSVLEGNLMATGSKLQGVCNTLDGLTNTPQCNVVLRQLCPQKHSGLSSYGVCWTVPEQLYKTKVLIGKLKPTRTLPPTSDGNVIMMTSEEITPHTNAATPPSVYSNITVTYPSFNWLIASAMAATSSVVQWLILNMPPSFLRRPTHTINLYILHIVLYSLTIGYINSHMLRPLWSNLGDILSVTEFIAYIEEQASYMKTDHVLVTMGGDFHYQEAASWFVNLDKLIKYVNERQTEGSKLHALYSTPSCYLKAVNDANIKWELKEDDFFPYAGDAHEYWTGYFTSRATSKYFERQGNNFLQVCKQLYALADVEGTYSEDLEKLQDIMGIYQHHDAITGTEKQNVCDDYNLMLYDGFQHCGKIVDRALNKISAGGVSTLSFSSCLLSNISQCDISESSSNFVVTVYNPLSQATSYYVRIPVQDGTYSVTDANGNEQIIQLVPLPDAIYNVPGRDSNATQEIVFQATDVPALGYYSYYVSSTKQERSYSNIISENAAYIGNNYLQVILHETQGTVKSVIINGTELPLSQNFYYYEGWAGTNAGPDERSSGAYIFRPVGSEATMVSGTATVKIYKGDVVEEVHQTFSDWISQVIRIYKTEKHIEFEWLVGPIPTEDRVGKEIISRFNTNLVNNETFYTDSNGREMIQRRVNYRPTWDYVVEEPVSGNYYPITSKIVIKDENKGLEMAVLNDRAQGGSSLRNGEVELMIHRRLLYDDGMGVAEPLREQAFGKGLVVRGKHWLLMGNITEGDGWSLASQERFLAQKKLLSPWVLLSNADNVAFTEWTNSHETQFSGLRQELPQNIKILTLEPWKDNSLLLRLEHILENEEDTNLSQPATVNLEALFTPFSISSIRETTLGGNQWLEDNTRLIWVDEEGTPSTTRQSKEDIPNVTLEPMEIRTFVIEIDYQKAHHNKH
ncbi:lysosomal alpha-mannosidase-like [Schistocerca americana]|uniref:lysosomal alpha-mannosidase-like n=1 Tax=Schistocerca americana TaxID=7009 RepID=UPI001F4F6201|nr:lysosomal alpha-mannosidase-like [Schistocerca americana]